jgi:hypothetical protein
MGTLFGILLLTVLVVGVVRVTRPRALEPYHEYEPEEVDEPVGEPLPADLLEPFVEGCAEIAAATLDIVDICDEVAAHLAKKDGMGPVEAAGRWGDLEGELGRIDEATAALTELGSLPDEAGWWLSFVVEQAELLRQVDGDGRVTGGAGGPAARGAVVTAAERADALLFGCHEFSERLLHTDLQAYFEERRGKKAARRYRRAVDEARGREG